MLGMVQELEAEIDQDLISTREMIEDEIVLPALERGDLFLVRARRFR